ncbi:hypothetical protein VNO77_33986 [Canavalia gladiata]|uniref:Uncharacterized protein n=1 Tax=Canavalia gladiata TaxID=3824 RepID=A0AAN9PZF9_CANGL
MVAASHWTMPLDHAQMDAPGPRPNVGYLQEKVNGGINPMYCTLVVWSLKNLRINSTQTKGLRGLYDISVRTMANFRHSLQGLIPIHKQAGTYENSTQFFRNGDGRASKLLSQGPLFCVSISRSGFGFQTWLYLWHSRLRVPDLNSLDLLNPINGSFSPPLYFSRLEGGLEEEKGEVSPKESSKESSEEHLLCCEKGGDHPPRTSLTQSQDGPSRENHFGARQNHGSTRAAPVWLKIGDTVANMYSELLEEACNHACNSWLSGWNKTSSNHNALAPLMQSPRVLRNQLDIVIGSPIVHRLGLVHLEKAFNFHNKLHAYQASCGVDGVKDNMLNILISLGCWSI